MNIGFYSAIFRDQPIETFAAWAGANGFSTLEIDANHHLPNLSQIGSVCEHLQGVGLSTSSLVHFGALLDQHESYEQQQRQRARECLLAASEASVPSVVLFPGRNMQQSEAADYEELAGFLDELTSYSLAYPAKILLENWPGFSKSSIATTPQGWSRIFSLTHSSRVGLEFDPSHLLFQGIDAVAAFSAVAERVHLIHAKDTKLFHQQLPQVGYYGNWWSYCLPGQGALDWFSFLSAVTAAGNPSDIIIEHEDATHGWPNGSLKLRQEGLLLAREKIEKTLLTLESKQIEKPVETYCKHQ